MDPKNRFTAKALDGLLDNRSYGQPGFNRKGAKECIGC
jgi:hypothetical protein